MLLVIRLFDSVLKLIINIKRLGIQSMYLNADAFRTVPLYGHCGAAFGGTTQAAGVR